MKKEIREQKKDIPFRGVFFCILKNRKTVKGGKEDETLSEPDTDFRFQLDGNHEKTYERLFL